MNKKVYELLNDQINKELYSAYLYLDISNFYSDQGLDGFASWYRIQAAEEEEHAMKIYDYLLDNGQKVVLKAIDAPEEKFKDLSAPIDKAAEHERYVTSLIHAIYEAAVKAKDYRTTQFLDWFVAEQGEEEKNADDLVSKMALFGGDPKSLYLLDQELAGRQAEGGGE